MLHKRDAFTLHPTGANLARMHAIRISVPDALGVCVLGAYIKVPESECTVRDVVEIGIHPSHKQRRSDAATAAVADRRWVMGLR